MMQEAFAGVDGVEGVDEIGLWTDCGGIITAAELICGDTFFM
jgi:hypothetical protein